MSEERDVAMSSVMRRVDAHMLSYLVFDPLTRIEGFAHGIALRQRPENASGPELAPLDFSLQHHPEYAQACLFHLADALGLDGHHVCRAEQVHGCHVHWVEGHSSVAPASDALVTNGAGIGLSLLGADCILVMVCDPVTRTVGLAHAGWRGTVQRICEQLVSCMKQRTGAQPQDMHAGIGPGICGRCYQVDQPVIEQFQRNFSSSQCQVFLHPDPRSSSHALLALAQANALQLAQVGLHPSHIYQSELCTLENPDWFPSYRRDGAQAGRWMLLAGWTCDT